MDYLLVFANFLKNIFLKLINILSFIKIINKKKKKFSDLNYNNNKF